MKIKPGDLVKVFDLFPLAEQSTYCWLDSYSNLRNKDEKRKFVWYTHDDNPMLYVGPEVDSNFVTFYRFLHQGRLWRFDVLLTYAGHPSSLEDYFYKVKFSIP